MRVWVKLSPPHSRARCKQASAQEQTAWPPGPISKLLWPRLECSATCIRLYEASSRGPDSRLAAAPPADLAVAAVPAGLVASTTGSPRLKAEPLKHLPLHLLLLLQLHVCHPQPLTEPATRCPTTKPLAPPGPAKRDAPWIPFASRACRTRSIAWLQG